MEVHIKALGIIHLVLGAIACLSALAFGLLFFGVGFLGGAAAMAEGDAEAGLAAFGILGTIGAFVAGCAGLLSLPGMLAGYGLLTGKKWAPILAVVIGMLTMGE